MEHAREIMNDATYSRHHTGDNRSRRRHGEPGAAHTTVHTVRLALEIIKIVPHIHFVSSIFLMFARTGYWRT